MLICVNFLNFRLLALKALNSRLTDGPKDTTKSNNLDPERRSEVVISIGESEHTSQET